MSVMPLMQFGEQMQQATLWKPIQQLVCFQLLSYNYSYPSSLINKYVLYY